MLQLHLSDQQFYYLLRCLLHQRFEGKSGKWRHVVNAMADDGIVNTFGQWTTFSWKLCCHWQKGLSVKIHSVRSIWWNKPFVFNSRPRANAVTCTLLWRHMSIVVSQTGNSLTVCSTAHSGLKQRKHKSSTLLALCEENHHPIEHNLNIPLD